MKCQNCSKDLIEGMNYGPAKNLCYSCWFKIKDVPAVVTAVGKKFVSRQGNKFLSITLPFGRPIGVLRHSVGPCGESTGIFALMRGTNPEEVVTQHFNVAMSPTPRMWA